MYIANIMYIITKLQIIQIIQCCEITLTIKYIIAKLQFAWLYGILYAQYNNAIISANRIKR